MMSKCKWWEGLCGCAQLKHLEVQPPKLRIHKGGNYIYKSFSKVFIPAHKYNISDKQISADKISQPVDGLGTRT